MIIAVIQASLTDPGPASAITSATNWVSDLLFGPLATVIAVIAIASIGFAMLTGRIDLRRGLAVVLGCFLLFGARGVADSLRYLTAGDEVLPNYSVPSPPTFTKAPFSANTANAFDPYAGAAVMRPMSEARVDSNVKPITSN